MAEINIHLLSLTGGAMLCWMAAAVYRELGDPSPQGKPFRPHDLPLLGLTVLLGALWFFTFIKPSGALPVEVAAAGTINPVPVAAGCVSVKPAMNAQQVTAILGKADQVSSEEDVYGPGAERWKFTQARCTVHLLDGLVQRVD